MNVLKIVSVPVPLQIRIIRLGTFETKKKTSMVCFFSFIILMYWQCTLKSLLFYVDTEIYNKTINCLTLNINIFSCVGRGGGDQPIISTIYVMKINCKLKHTGTRTHIHTFLSNIVFWHDNQLKKIKLTDSLARS